MKWVSKLACQLGVHGPEWFGYGIDNSTPRNYNVGPGHRRCTMCGKEWGAYEGISRGPYRKIEWGVIKEGDLR